ncbi:DUF5305 domain-containing protein [Salinilacihabitans rarus]|uniref:DUF5305 domain-containing protein n=1 Tax=Salinilacihabitans rarus TaxID=2961596 RepID=UPI0020C8BFBE|nr:DUF5305 domain-containing protein [Salinilacihabitans rarus]
MIDSPRLELLIAERGRTLVVALALVGLVSAASAGWVVATPETTTATQERTAETVETEVHTSAVVVEDGLWEAGESLEESSVYLTNATPTLTLTPETAVPSDDAAVTHELAVRYEAVRDGETFWEDRDVVLREEAPVEDGLARSEAALDVREVVDRTREVESELRGVGTVEVSLALRVAYDTGANEGALTATSPLRVGADAYWLEESLADDEDHPETVEVEVTETPSPLRVGGLAALAAVSLAGAAFVARRSPADPEAARRAVHERRYAEWISRGTIPMRIGDHHVALDTLEDVVDVAIDTGERVVHDRQRDLFAVVSDDVVYYYAERGNWKETAWPETNTEAKPPEDDDRPPEGTPASPDGRPDDDLGCPDR